MKKLLLALPLVMLVAACENQTSEEKMLTGALAGAAVGAAVSSPGDRPAGALAGTVAGLAAGALIGHSASGDCVYQRQNGTRFVGPCN